ncbi:MAG: hypothetical protein ACK528_03560, partial [Alphaproteobacteria bacterium]
MASLKLSLRDWNAAWGQSKVPIGAAAQIRRRREGKMLKQVRALAALAMLVAVTACATSAPRMFEGEFQRPADNSRIIVMTPDVQLSVLTAAGLQEPREDWSVSGRDNLTTAVAALIQAQSHTTSSLDPATAMEGRVGQVIRLHDAVGSSILAINYGYYS